MEGANGELNSLEASLQEACVAMLNPITDIAAEAPMAPLPFRDASLGTSGRRHGRGSPGPNGSPRVV